MKKTREIRGTLHPVGTHEAPTYFECPHCGFLTADPRFGASEIPCPVCKAHGDGRRTFPTDRLRGLDARIRRYHADGESEIVVILAETLLEAILEDIIDRILASRGADLKVREAVLDGQRAIGARIGRLFPSLTGEEFEEAASEMGYREFPRRWREVRQARNSFIHDTPFRNVNQILDKATADKSMDLLDQAYRLFVLINNRFVVDLRKGAPYAAAE